MCLHCQNMPSRYTRSVDEELVPGVFVCYERPPLQCMDQGPTDILSHTIIWSHDEVTRSYGLLAKSKTQGIYCIVSISQPGNLSRKQERGPLFLVNPCWILITTCFPVFTCWNSKVLGFSSYCTDYSLAESFAGSSSPPQPFDIRGSQSKVFGSCLFSTLIFFKVSC